MPESLVLIPTYNERENIADMITAVMAQPGMMHLLVIDDGSPDGTAQIVKDHFGQYPGRLFIEERSGKLGLGTAYLHGFRWGLERGYEFIFEMDADFSHNPADLPRLLAACKDENYDLAVGSRYINGVNVVNWPMSRVLLSWFASAYVRFITGMSVRDATAGFKCYRAHTLRTLLKKPVKFVGYAFQIEMKFKAWKYGFKIKEVPIIFTDRTRGTSKMSGKIVREAVFGVLNLKITSWFGDWRR
jgi:dolichol-phosphate mannosyltransferase